MIEAVFFDMDNTLVHTEWAAGLALRNVLQGVGVALEPADEQAVIGLPWETVFANALSKYHIDWTSERLRRKVLEEKAKILGGKPKALPGALEALRLCAARWPVAVVSGSYREEVVPILDALDISRKIRFCLGNEDTDRGKPDPEPYLVAANRLSADPCRCLVFEDSEIGIESGRSAGMTVVAVEQANDAGLCLDAADLRIASLEVVDDKWLDEIASTVEEKR